VRTPAQATTPRRAPLVASGDADVMVGAGTMTITTLYRFFDVDGGLLYVGIAGNPARRAHDHSKTKPWWTDVARSTMEHYTTREAAAAAEVAAIITERPLHNVTHNHGGASGNTPDAIKLGDRRTYPSGRLADGTPWWLEWYGGAYCNLVVDWVWGLPPQVDENEWLTRSTLGAGAVLALNGDDVGISTGIRCLPHPPGWTHHTIDFMHHATRTVTTDTWSWVNT